jgi:hypothetical protein
MSWTRRAVLLGAGAVAGAAAARAVNAPSLAGAGLVTPRGGEGVLNDASLLSETPVDAPCGAAQTRARRLVGALRRSCGPGAAEGRPVSYRGGAAFDGGARRSRGGACDHAGGPPGSRPMRRRGDALQRACAGATPSRRLDPLGLSPQGMQVEQRFRDSRDLQRERPRLPTAIRSHGSTGRKRRDDAARWQPRDRIRARTTRSSSTRRWAAMSPGAFSPGWRWGGAEPLLEPSFLACLRRLRPGLRRKPPRALAHDLRALNLDREACFFEDALLVSYAPSRGRFPPAEGSGLLQPRLGPVFRAQVLGLGPPAALVDGASPAPAGRTRHAHTRSSSEPAVTLEIRDRPRAPTSCTSTSWRPSASATSWRRRGIGSSGELS